MPAKPYRRPGRSKWHVVVEIPAGPDGKRRQRTLTADTRKEVVAKQVELLRKVATGTGIDPATVTVAEYLARWLEEVVRPTQAENSYLKFESLARNHIIPHIGGYLLAKLQPSHVTAMLAALAKRGLAASTVVQIRQQLHMALAHAVKRWRLIAINVVEDVDPPLHIAAHGDLWNEAQVRRFLAMIGGRRFEPLYRLALDTGIRQAELLGLRWSDIDLQRGLIVVRRQTLRSAARREYIDKGTKGKRGRAVAIAAGTIATLVAHRAAQEAARAGAGDEWRDEDRVFPNLTGGPLPRGTVNSDWRRTIRALALPHMTFHDLRHLHATYLLLEGIHPKIVAERLGHATTAITMEVYSHVTPTMQGQAALAYERALRRVVGAEAGAENGAGETPGVPNV